MAMSNYGRVAVWTVRWMDACCLCFSLTVVGLLYHSNCVLTAERTVFLAHRIGGLMDWLTHRVRLGGFDPLEEHYLGAVSESEAFRKQPGWWDTGRIGGGVVLSAGLLTHSGPGLAVS